MPITLNGDTGIQTPMYNGTITDNAVTPSVNMKNRIINGAMVTDQRNAGAAVTTASSFPVDRFLIALTSNNGTFSAQQSTTVVPTGFTHSVGITVTAADASIASTENFGYQSWIEGNNIADLGFGTASAKTVTVSFWVRGSVTGTYAVVIGNSNAGTGAANRSYVSTYTINSANTWEYKTVTVAGDTSGTWQTGNLRGMLVRFGLTAGTDFQQAAGSWGTANAFGTSSTVQLLSTLNATWFITGVQLEVGSTATSFDYRPYGTELALCQRYYARMNSLNGNFIGFGSGVDISTTAALVVINYPTTMRAAPTLAVSNVRITDGASDATVTSLTATYYGSNSLVTQVAVASGLAASRGCVLLGNNNAAAYVELSSEL